MLCLDCYTFSTLSCTAAIKILLSTSKLLVKSTSYLYWSCTSQTVMHFWKCLDRCAYRQLSRITKLRLDTEESCLAIGYGFLKPDLVFLRGVFFVIVLKLSKLIRVPEKENFRRYFRKRDASQWSRWLLRPGSTGCLCLIICRPYGIHCVEVTWATERCLVWTKQGAVHALLQRRLFGDPVLMSASKQACGCSPGRCCCAWHLCSGLVIFQV